MLNISLSICIACIVLFGCRSYERPSGFDMQKEVWDATDIDTSAKKPVYLIGTKNVDSADADKMIYELFRLNWNKYPEKIEIHARVFDSTGLFITGMADPYKKDKDKKYFSLLSETLGKVYKPRDTSIFDYTVREFGADDSIAYNIVLTIDYSGSMDNVMSAIHEGTQIFVSLKYPYDKIGINTFNRDFDVKVPLSSNKEDIINIFNMKKNNGIGLFSGVLNAAYKSIEQLKETESDRPRILVLFSDGDDNYSSAKVTQIIEEATKENINIFTVAWGYSLDENLKLMSKYTGGKFYRARSREEMINIFKDIYNSLRQYYLITYKPPVYWGFHKVKTGIQLSESATPIMAEGDYNTEGLWSINDTSDVFKRPIFFEFNKDTILAQSFYILDEIADVMLSKPSMRLEIRGHTDNVGTEEYNLALSDRRARNVMLALMQRGIEDYRLRYRGFGFTMPLVPNDTQEGRDKNRRTEFKVIAR